MEKMLCSRREAAGSLSISVRQLDYLIERGHFKVKRIGSRVLLRCDDVERFSKGDHPTL